ncbi:MAG TPA: NAD(P)-dependent oxidoreductase [Acidimicrobiales bacterium]|nr:NAD(P)-dependent oxidoreductase [Acidimicrobiales bacterium]
MTTSPVESLHLGFIGLGNIGGAIAANLLADGHQLTVLDTDVSRSTELAGAGAKVASDPAEVAAGSDWTFLSLPTPAIVESVARQWCTADVQGKVLLDLSTNAPATVRQLGAVVAGAGATLVEAPLTGGAIGARNRQLVFILGGDDGVVAEVTPLLMTVGRATFHLGPLGNGNVGKLVNSLVAFATTWVSLEGLALAAKHDVDLRTVVDMVRTSGAAMPYLDKRVEGIAQRGRPAEFALELAAKDAGLMVEAGREVGAPMPVASALLQVLAFAVGQGLGDRDFSDFVEVAERAAAVELVLAPAPEG